MNRRIVLGAAMLALASAPALGQQKPVRIGVLNDLSTVYADFQGQGSIIAARLAAEDFGKALGQPVEIVYADHQNKTDIGANIARQWFDTGGIDMIVDVPN